MYDQETPKSPSTKSSLSLSRGQKGASGDVICVIVTRSLGNRDKEGGIGV